MLSQIGLLKYSQEVIMHNVYVLRSESLLHSTSGLKSFDFNQVKLDGNVLTVKYKQKPQEYSLHKNKYE